MQADCFAGTTFHVDNQIEANVSTGIVSIHGGKFSIKQHNSSPAGRPRAYPPPALTVGDLNNEIETDGQINNMDMIQLATEIKLLKSKVSDITKMREIDAEENITNDVDTNDVDKIKGDDIKMDEIKMAGTFIRRFFQVLTLN